MEPDRLLYAVRWLHKAEPPDLDLALAPPFARAPEILFPYVTTITRSASRRLPGERPWVSPPPPS
jgi:hypothetical protein